MSTQLPANTKDDTREKLLDAAHMLFAERGFHGASIALIAGEVGLTKQALLYHFKRKEELYGEVLRRIAERLMASMRTAIDPAKTAELQFEDTILNIFNTAMEHPLDTKVLMRELIDNQRQDAPEDQWFLKTFLNELVSKLELVEVQSDLPFADKLARIYLLLSAIQFYVGSGSVLSRFYGDEESQRIGDYYPTQLRDLVQRLLTSKAAFP